MPFKKKSEEPFCVRVRYTKSAKATSFIQCKQMFKTVVLSEKLTNIERLNHVARVEETGGIRPIFMARRTVYRQSFLILPLCSNYVNFL